MQKARESANKSTIGHFIMPRLESSSTQTALNNTYVIMTTNRQINTVALTIKYAFPSCCTFNSEPYSYLSVCVTLSNTTQQF